MVSPTLALFVRARGPDEFWRKRKIFKLAAVSFRKIIWYIFEDLT